MPVDIDVARHDDTRSLPVERPLPAEDDGQVGLVAPEATVGGLGVVDNGVSAGERDAVSHQNPLRLPDIVQDYPGEGRAGREIVLGRAGGDLRTVEDERIAGQRSVVP